MKAITVGILAALALGGCGSNDSRPASVATAPGAPSSGPPGTADDDCAVQRAKVLRQAAETEDMIKRKQLEDSAPQCATTVSPDQVRVTQPANEPASGVP